MSEQRPRVSVIMPAYNCGPYLEQSINSILKQTYTNLELVICDDGSTDNSWEVICSFKDNRISKLRHDVNKGYLQTYNFLLTQANGELICCQDADDWSGLTRIEEQVTVFEAEPSIALCGCNGLFYYNEEIQKKCPDFPSGFITLDKNNFNFMLPSIMYRRNVLKSVKGFHPYFDRLTGMDQYFILELLSEFKGYAINRCLYFARFNPTSNHRSLDNLRKLTTPDAYFLLKAQRVDTGTDWLKQGRDDLLLEFEQGLMKNRKFMSEKFREYAAYRFDSHRLADGFMLLLRSLFNSPWSSQNYRTLWYGIRKMIGVS
jgi:glycosyltransferase involved in cell wall biosynthesis